MRARWFSVLAVALLSSCATGADEEDDGVIRRRDASADTGEIEEDTSAEEDTSTTEEDSRVVADTSVAKDTASAGEDSSTTDTATGGDDTGAGGDTGSGADTAPVDTGPTPCTGEEAEPNDTPSTARKLGAIDDCDGSGKTVNGVLSSSSDVDVLTFDGSDVFGCSVNPTAKVTGPVRVCIQAVCKSGTTEIKSCPKGVRTGSECCGAPEAAIEINCTGTTSEDTKVTMTVRGDGSSLTCAGYSLAYHY
ncbi:MAG: hypothetical protein HYV09_12530 [Deltaproteobacteria bacterium]|nr:hypothetical protein [Deltaproteobacteria bacterium]